MDNDLSRIDPDMGISFKSKLSQKENIFKPKKEKQTLSKDQQAFERLYEMDVIYTL